MLNREPLPTVKIISEGTNTQIFMDGHKVPNVMEYSIEQNAQDKAVPILTLKVQCKLDIEHQMCPKLPMPWSLFYVPKIEGAITADEYLERISSPKDNAV